MTGFDIESHRGSTMLAEQAEAEHLPAHPSQPAVTIPARGRLNRVTITEVPPSVKVAIEKVTAGRTIKSIEKIESGGKVTYEVEYMKDGKELDAYFTEDGQPVKGAQ